ncbi:MAG: twin-arginine translocation signal domain-containing protein [Bacteroidales bacterium]|nr:twin-arginine translocation signal domain-containing protein [Bacteroidales bacterium]
MPLPRREFLKKSAVASAALFTGLHNQASADPLRPKVTIVNPLNRVPVSFIIDDSTALVNMAHFGIPQFHEVFPDQYPQDWRKLPREIPDAFVREFGEWCIDQGVKGKYSMVPYPACTGWLHRFIPGWTKRELEDSLKLVREFMMPNWDIHPEMISHTRVINIKTGQPYPDALPEYMENWEWSQDKSSDELGSYMAYALNILKEAGLNCEGITTPGGFGSRNMENLAKGTLEAVRDVFKADIPHFFRDVITDPGISVEPQLFHVSGLDTTDPRCSVHIIGCTDDWFGGWDGISPGNPDLFITEDLQKGRLVDVIDKGEPAILVCHWPGIYFNGKKTGFNIFKQVVSRLNQKYNNLIWMKNSEIARYWAAKKLTDIALQDHDIVLKAPFGTERFTIHIDKKIRNLSLNHEGRELILKTASDSLSLKTGAFCWDATGTVVSFDLEKGITHLKYY